MSSKNYNKKRHLVENCCQFLHIFNLRNDLHIKHFLKVEFQKLHLRFLPINEYKKVASPIPKRTPNCC